MSNDIVYGKVEVQDQEGMLWVLYDYVGKVFVSRAMPGNLELSLRPWSSARLGLYLYEAEGLSRA